MEKFVDSQNFPALQKDDAGLIGEIMALLTARAVGNPYSADGSFAASLATLPPGLRAMATTHWLDLSLTLDSITWHFGNFGEPHLVAETEAGLEELGLKELALCFHEAKDLMLPLLSERTAADGDPHEIIERKGLQKVAEELDRRAWALGRAWALDSRRPRKSVIYAAWVEYTRQHPERVFTS